jgi:endonuclease/exonuclease/phosphatase family metal-dependent hydrolase
VAGLGKGYLRPLDLRTSAFNLLEGYREKFDNTFIQCSYKKDTLKVMTYNVHGCVGMDGRLSPSRISEVISQYEPDIVALQELDVGRQRSGKEDQAMLIAEYLNMDHHFHASLQLAEESFGDAILSSYPMQLIKKDALSRNSNFYFLEPRGALWVEVNFNSQPIQIINTHLGLNSKERMLHAKELIDNKWLAHPQCKGSVILCGDFNALAYSGAFKILQGTLSSVQTRKGRIRHKGTWFGRYPVACLDHIFISTNIEIVRVEVCDSHLARLASDHRPLIAEIKIFKTD